MTLIDLQRWTFVASLAVLALLGIWVYRNRRADVWLLLGVSAIAARFWTYHRWYDDLLILLPIITLWRMSSSQTSPGMTSTRWLLGALVVTSLAPGGLFFLPPPLDGLYVIVQLMIWLAALAHLLSSPRRHA